MICPDTHRPRPEPVEPASPSSEYCLAFYVRLAAALVDQLGLERFHWLGTSMGGAIGTRGRGRTRCAAASAAWCSTTTARSSREAAIERIRSYAGNPAAFATVSELEAYFRTVYKPYGWLSDAQWRRLTETSMRRLPDGRVTPHYDPAMVMQFTHHDDDYERWDEWDTLDIPVLCLRGEDSDLLLRETAEQMRERGPRAVVVEIAGCGHAPALNTPEQFALVERFLAG